MFNITFAKKTIVTVLIAVFCVSASFIVGVLAADPSPRAMLMEEQNRLSIEIMKNSKRWMELSGIVKEQDQFCTVAKGMHDEMEALSQVNEQKRQRSSEITAKLAGF